MNYEFTYFVQKQKNSVKFSSVNDMLDFARRIADGKTHGVMHFIEPGKGYAVGSLTNLTTGKIRLSWRIKVKSSKRIICEECGNELESEGACPECGSTMYSVNQYDWDDHEEFLA